ncbi:MAG TPA: elongation factor G [Stellaceae bacterium]|nr:elongation factor G [Stellaceae bacterium]
MAEKPNGKSSGARVAALVGPYLSGKTTLLESILAACGAISRRGSAKEANTVGDHAPEARARQMSTEINVASTTYLEDPWTFLDCPGSIELAWEAQCAMLAADVAVVVCEPEIERVLALSPLFKFLDDHHIPHMVFINKMDIATLGVGEILAALQSVSTLPLVLRQVPLPGPEGLAAGYVDLVSERAYHYVPGQASRLIELPAEAKEGERTRRNGLVEALADFDDVLLERLLEDVQPSTDEIYRHLTSDFRRDLIVPVFLGAAVEDHGVRRLLKALRHETPECEVAAARLKITPEAEVVEGAVTAHVIKTFTPPHAGKLSLTRVWSGEIEEGMTLNGTRVAAIWRLLGAASEKRARAGRGEVVALARLEGVATGAVLGATSSPSTPASLAPPLPRPLYGLALTALHARDDVKLTGAIARLIEEDPTLSLEQNAMTREMVLWGQGDIHLQIALDRLRHKYHLELTARRPHVSYHETIRRGTVQRSRFRRQTGGHGQFADIEIEVTPVPRGSGSSFTDKVVGGAIPRNYIPAVEEGVNDTLRHGPLGFPVADVAVSLRTGQFHTVDSSDQAFKTVARMAMSEALAKCAPVLLEPIHQVEIAVPNAFTSRVQRIVSARRGQIQGFDARGDWPGWDVVTVALPQAELHDLILELRSATLGLGSYTERFDHLQELTGKLAERVLSGHGDEAALARE